MSLLTTPDLGVQAGWPARFSGWKEGMDKNLIVLSAFARGVADGVGITSLPVEAVPGSLYLVATNPPAWGSPELEGKDAFIAIKLESEWCFIPPQIGMSFVDPVAASLYFNSGFGWVAAASPLSTNYIALIDMEGGDFVMNKAQAEAAVKVILNGVKGATLLWPAESKSTSPISQLVFSLYSEEGVKLALEGEAVFAQTLLASPMTQIFFSREQGIFLVDSRRPGARTIESPSYTVGAYDCGATLKVNYPTDVTLQIGPADISDDGFNFKVVQEGLGRAVFSALPGVVLLNVHGHTQSLGAGSVVNFLGIGNSTVVFSGDTAP